MKIFRYIGTLIGLSLYSCAEVSKIGNLSDLELCPPELIHNIASYLDNPFLGLGFVNPHFYGILTTFPIKETVYERLGIPELYTEGIDEYEPELKIILSVTKYKNPYHFHQALQAEFLKGNRFDRLLPNLMKYFYRVNGNRSTSDEISVMVDRNQFDYFFQSGEFPTEKFFTSNEKIKALQEYLSSHLSNSEYFEHIFRYFNTPYSDIVREHINEWNMLALASNLPEKFLVGRSHLLENLNTPPSFWTRFPINPSHFKDIFNTINDLINISHHIYEKHLYNLLNRVRFGPDDSNIYNEVIRFEDDTIFLFCECASLANKMDLFKALLPKVAHYIKRIKYAVATLSDCGEPMPLSLLKFKFDVYQYGNDSVRKALYDKNLFAEVLFPHSRVISIKTERKLFFGTKDLVIELKTSPEVVASGMPESVTIRRKFSSEKELEDFEMSLICLATIDNSEIFEGILRKYLNQFISVNRKMRINADNFKFILKSSSIRHLLRYGHGNVPINYKLFVVDVEELLEAVKEPVCYLGDIFIHFSSEREILYKFRTHQQLQRLETIMGHSVAQFLNPNFDYFKYKHIFKYLIETDQELPIDLCEKTRTLLKIDYP